MVFMVARSPRSHLRADAWMRRFALIGTFIFLLRGLGACSGEEPSGLKLEENEGSFTATVSGMFDTTFAGEAAFTGLDVGATLRLDAASTSGEPSFGVSGAWPQFAVGTHAFGPDLYPSYSGHGEEYWTLAAGTLTITHRDGDRIGGSVDVWMRAVVNDGGTLRTDSIRLNATFESDGVIIP